MKGISFTFDMGMILIEILLLIIFVVLLWQAVGNLMNPDVQTVMFNSQLLQSKIEEACINGEAELKNFNFPQPTPSMLLGSDILAAFSIKSGGDPHYVLYYEMFPEGEGLGWELYQEFPNRIIAPFVYQGSYDPVEGIPRTEFEEKLLEHINEADQLVQQRFEDPAFAEDNPGIVDAERKILVNNIMLSEYLNAIPTDFPPEAIIKSEDIEGNAGKWEDGVFKFSNYRGLNELEQSFIKYRACGDNTLCLKTREAVYPFPLENCAGVEYIQLNYDARGRWKIYTAGAIGVGVALVVGPPTLVGAGIETMESVVGIPKFGPWIAALGIGFLAQRGTVWVLGNFLTFKNSDFYVASPCKIESTIKITTDCDVCNEMIKYPIYEYALEKNEMLVKEIGQHYTCLEGKGKEFVGDYEIVKENNVFNEIRNKCIKITVEEKPSNFCWTANPYKEGILDWDSAAVATVMEKVFKTDINVIRKNTAVISNRDITALLIKPIERLKGWGLVKAAGEKIIDIDFRWPSGFLTPS